MSVVRTRDLSKSFRHTHAVEKLNLEIEEGSIFALVGPNGAGKTTTIKTLMNILRPSAGAAEVLGTNSRRLGPAEFSQIGYVSENQELPLWMTVDYLMSWLKTLLPGLGQCLGGRTASAIGPAPWPPAARAFARHADQGGIGFIARLPSQADRLGRAVRRPRFPRTR